jgi:hypothetical protein
MEIGDQVRVRERDRALRREAARQVDLLLGEAGRRPAEVERHVAEQLALPLDCDEQRGEDPELLLRELGQRLSFGPAS